MPCKKKIKKKFCEESDIFCIFIFVARYRTIDFFIFVFLLIIFTYYITIIILLLRLFMIILLFYSRTYI